MDMYEEVHMKRTTLAKKLRIALAVMAFAGCATSFAADSTADAAAAPAAKTQNEMKRQLTREATYMEEQLTLTQEWDKTFPKSDKVNHRKVTFHNRYGITLAADLYEPKTRIPDHRLRPVLYRRKRRPAEIRRLAGHQHRRLPGSRRFPFRSG